LLCRSSMSTCCVVISGPQYHYYLLPQPKVQHTDMATRVVGAKEPNPHPHNQPYIPSSHISHSTCRTLNYIQPSLSTPFNYSIICADRCATSPR
jgi:hypothetical protein